MNVFATTISADPVLMKAALISRMIELGRKCNQPGFDDPNEALVHKFMQMRNNELMTVFELIVIQAHKDGEQ